MRVLTDLPSYPWNHQRRHWLEPRLNRALRERALPPHDLLGSFVPGTNPDAPSWRHILRAAEMPWVRDHVVQSNIVFPGAGYICLAIKAIRAAIRQTTSVEAAAAAAAAATTTTTSAEEITDYRLRDVDILQALMVPGNSDGIEIQTVLRPVSDKAIGASGWGQFEVMSVTAYNRWT
jgi:acyl transferase domain-containing protein